MRTIFVQTLWESFHRRMGLALITISALVPLLYLAFVDFRTQADGTVLVLTARGSTQLAATYVKDTFEMLSGPIIQLWLWLGIFAAAPLLTSFMEKGWVDLLLSKGIPRWRILLGRYVGSLALFLLALALLDGVTALYFWARTGVNPERFLVAVTIIAFSFTTLLALMALVAVALPNSAIVIMLAFLMAFFSSFLANRQRALYDIITAKWAQWFIDWVYRILPKTFELGQMALKYQRIGTVESWWPVWSSAVFLVAALATAYWVFHRKSF